MGLKTRILEQIHSGETPASEYLGSNLTVDLSELNISDKAILALYPASSMLKAVESKLKTAQRSKNNVLTGHFTWTIQKVISCAAVLCLALLIPIFTRQNNSTTATSHGVTMEETLDVNRAKGIGSRIYIYKKDGETAKKLENRSTIHAGDVIQISYIAAGAKFGSIISIDGNGVLTQHYPDYGTKAISLESNGEIPLEYSYKLDDAPSFERFILITSDSEFSINEVIDAVEHFQNKERAKDADFSKYLPKQAKVTDLLLLK